MSKMTERERALIESISALRSTHGDESAMRTTQVLIECVRFVCSGGHGNVTFAVKNHRVGSQMKFEYYKEVDPK